MEITIQPTMDTIRTFTREGDEETDLWRGRILPASAVARLEVYEARITEAIAARWPEAEVTISSEQVRSSGAEFTCDESIAEELREITGAAWVAACQWEPEAA